VARLDWIFISYALAAGLAAGAVSVLLPQSNTVAISPYFWVLIAIALFETAAIVLRGFDRGPPLTMKVRVIGFIVGTVAMVIVRTLGGVQ